jgi:hypothetical protein
MTLSMLDAVESSITVQYSSTGVDSILRRKHPSTHETVLKKNLFSIARALFCHSSDSSTGKEGIKSIPSIIHFYYSFSHVVSDPSASATDPPPWLLLL